MTQADDNEGGFGMEKMYLKGEKEKEVVPWYLALKNVERYFTISEGTWPGIAPRETWNLLIRLQQYKLVMTQTFISALDSSPVHCEKSQLSRKCCSLVNVGAAEILQE